MAFGPFRVAGVAGMGFSKRQQGGPRFLPRFHPTQTTVSGRDDIQHSGLKPVPLAFAQAGTAATAAAHGSNAMII
jgi:hypothetical protein